MFVLIAFPPALVLHGQVWKEERERDKESIERADDRRFISAHKSPVNCRITQRSTHTRTRDIRAVKLAVGVVPTDCTVKIRSRARAWVTTLARAIVCLRKCAHLYVHSRADRDPRSAIAHVAPTHGPPRGAS